LLLTVMVTGKFTGAATRATSGIAVKVLW
jgi:hypothetical protein